MSVQIDGLDGKVTRGGTFRMAAYTSALSSQTVLGVQMDTVALKTDIVSELYEKLRKNVEGLHRMRIAGIYVQHRLSP